MAPYSPTTSSTSLPVSGCTKSGSVPHASRSASSTRVASARSLDRSFDVAAGGNTVTMKFCILSAPFGDFGCVRAPLSAARGAPLFATRRSGPARLSGLVLPPFPDACLTATRSGLPGCAVGGFFLHVCSVFFLSKKGITNVYENFVAVRNAAKRGVLWIA